MDPLISAVEEALVAPAGALQPMPANPSAVLAGLADLQNVSAWLQDEVRAMSEALEQYRLYHLSSTESIALIDNTTLASTGTLLTGENAPTPHALLDLATFVNEYVLNDRLVFLPPAPVLRSTHEGMQYVSNRFPALTPLNISPAFETCLVRVWLDSREWTETFTLDAFSKISRNFAQSLAEGWRSLLPPHAEKGFTPESVLPDGFEASVKFGTAGEPGFFEALESINHIPVDLWDTLSPAAMEAIRLSNYRALYNVCVGQVLRIPYRGSVTRLPARKALWELGRALDAQLEMRQRTGLAHELDVQYRHAVEHLRRKRQVAVQLPVMLTYVLRKIDRLEDFPDELLSFREKFTGLRKRRAEIEAVLNGTESPEDDAKLQQLLAAFSDDCSAVSMALGAGVPVASATAGAVLGAASGPPGWLIGGLATIAATGGYSTQLSALWRRMRHRDLEIVRDLGQTVRTFSDARGKIESLWSVDTLKYDYENRFLRIASLEVF